MNRNLISPLVLIVDDDLTTTTILESMLRKVGFETLCAHNLKDAETYALSRTVSLILLDVHLPDGNGLDLCARLTAVPKMAGVPILFISANNDVETKVRGFAAGGVDYITKPLEVAEVLARVRTHLRLRAAYASLVELQPEHMQWQASSQQSLMPLPTSMPEARFAVCVRQSLHPGADFYDAFISGNKVADYVVTDASGHDPGTSLWTAVFRALLAEYATVLHAPLDICRTINLSLKRILPEGTHFSVIYARLNRAANKLTLVNAGHPCAILVSGQARKARLLQQNGDLIGIFPDASFGLMEIGVQPGDLFFLYSDGLVEMAGSGRLLDACNANAQNPLKDAVSSIVESMCSGAKPEGDIVLLGVEV